jgi:polyhydroxyalkanoate synthase
MADATAKAETITSAWPAGLLVEQQRFWRRMLSIPRVVEAAREARVGVTEYDIVFQRHTHKLVRYRRETPATHAEPVLFCYALVNRPYILDLQSGRSVVRQYLRAGFDVYMIDWGVPTHADRGLNLDDYVCGFLQDAVETVLRERDRDDLHLLGYCMGGTMSVLLAALRPRLVRTLTLLAAPIDFGGRESLLNLWAAPKHLGAFPGSPVTLTDGETGLLKG